MKAQVTNGKKAETKTVQVKGNGKLKSGLNPQILPKCI